MNPPNFLGIGASKSATTWLYEALDIHPNVWLPPTKELQYFDNQNDQHSHFSQILFRQKGYNKSISRFRYTSFRNINWVYKYLFKKRTIDNYIDLFSPNQNQIAGEITPTYAILESERIAGIHHFFTDIKIIYILRNPIHRDWSSVCMSYKNHSNQELKSAPVGQIIQKATHAKRLVHSEYMDNLQRWEQHFSSDQFFIGFFEEIREEPLGFLTRLFKFLELPTIDMSAFDSILKKKLNSFSIAIPSEVLTAIAKKEYSNISKTHRRFNNQYTAAWLEEVETILA